MFDPKEIIEELKYITEHYGDKIYDEENPEFFISEIYWCEEDQVFKFKTDREED